MKSTLQFYIEAEYPSNALESLAWLESSSECLGRFLESYRNLQPDGKLFSVESIAKIHRLNELSQVVARHMDERDYHEKMIEHYNHEIYCIENKLENIHQGCLKEVCISSDEF